MAGGSLQTGPQMAGPRSPEPGPGPAVRGREVRSAPASELARNQRSARSKCGSATRLVGWLSTVQLGPGVKPRACLGPHPGSWHHHRPGAGTSLLVNYTYRRPRSDIKMRAVTPALHIGLLAACCHHTCTTQVSAGGGCNRLSAFMLAMSPPSVICAFVAASGLQRMLLQSLDR